MTALIALFQPFAEWTYCQKGCGQLVNVREAVAVWSGDVGLGFAHETCPA